MPDSPHEAKLREAVNVASNTSVHESKAMASFAKACAADAESFCACFAAVAALFTVSKHTCNSVSRILTMPLPLPLLEEIVERRTWVLSVNGRSAVG